MYLCGIVTSGTITQEVKTNEVYYRITGSTKGNTFYLYYSAEGKSWFLIRTFKLDKTDNLSVGYSAQSLVGKGCKVLFSEIELQQRKLNDFWQGN
jgi:uncharacterized protein